MSDQRLRRTWSQLRRPQQVQITWPAAAWRGVLIGALVTAGAWAGELAWGSAAAFGALAVLMFPATIGRQRLVRAGIVLAVLLPTAGFVAMLSAGHWSLVVVIAAAGAVIGSVAAGNPAANGLGVPILATMIGLSGYPVPFDQALVRAGLLFCGAVVGAAAVLVMWPLERRGEVRLAVQQAVTSVQNWITADTQQNLRMVASAATTATAFQALDVVDLPAPDDEPLRRRLSAVAVQRLAVPAFLAGHPTSEQRQALAAQVGQVPDHGSPGPDVTRIQPPEVSFGQWLRSLLSPAVQPGSARIAGLRYGAALGASTALFLAFDIPHGYWIAMTVAMVLKPDFVTTLSRGVLRVAGTLAAAVLVTAGLHAIGSGAPWAFGVMIMIAAPFMIRWMSANYFWTAIAVTTTMLLLTEAADPTVTSVDQRIVNTALGAAVALAATLILPAWRGAGLPAALEHLLESLQEFVRLTVAPQRPTPGDPQLRSAVHATRMALTDAMSVADAAIIEPHRLPFDPEVGLDIVAAAMELGVETFAFAGCEPEAEPEILQMMLTTAGSLVVAVSRFRP